jgi:hypothetical protein
MSAVVAELTVRGLAQVDTTVELAVDERSGLPVLSLGRVVTAEHVADAMDDE